MASTDRLLSPDSTVMVAVAPTKKELESTKTVVNLIRMMIGMLQGFVVIAITMTFIYHLKTASTLVYLSLLQVPVFFAFIFSVIVIPLQYRRWVRFTGTKKAKTRSGENVVIAYILLHVLALLAGLGE
jgi:hypothetical protein